MSIRERRLSTASLATDDITEPDHCIAPNGRTYRVRTRYVDADGCDRVKLRATAEHDRQMFVGVHRLLNAIKHGDWEHVSREVR